MKVEPAAKEAIAERVEAGESQSQVAADVGVSQQAVSKIVNGEKKKKEAKQQRQEAARKVLMALW